MDNHVSDGGGVVKVGAGGGSIIIDFFFTFHTCFQSIFFWF